MSDRPIERARARGGGSRQERAAMRWSYRSRVDVYDTDDEMIAFVDVPGAHEDDTEVQFQDGVLRIHARIEPRQAAHTDYDVHEFGVGDFDREIEVGTIVDPEQIEAALRHGTLRIRMPKAQWARPRRIAINTSLSG